MATVLDTLITRLGFETDKSGLDKASKGLTDFKATAIKVAAGIGAVLGGSFFLNSVATAADETIKWADANGLAMQALGELEFAVQRQGGTVEGLRVSLSNMNRAIGEVQRGTGRAKLAFEDYGLSIEKADGSIKTADELLIDLNKKFATMSKAQQFDLAMKMGIDKNTIRLLQTAPEAIADLRKEAAALGVLTRQDAAAAAEFVDGMTNIGQAINAIKFEISGIVFEPLSRFFKEVAKGIAFIREYKRFFLILIGLITAVGVAYNFMAIAAAAAWVASLWPIILTTTLIAGVIAVLALLIDDFVAFFKGQDSAIGDLVKKWPKLGLAIYAIRDAVVNMFNSTIQGFKSTWKWLKLIGGGIKKFLINPLGTVTDLLKKLPVGKMFSKIFGIGGQNKDAPTGGDVLPVGTVSPANPVLANSNKTVTRTTDLKISAVNIDARGSDSQEIAQNVGAALGEQLKNTVEDFDSSIER